MKGILFCCPREEGRRPEQRKCVQALGELAAQRCGGGAGRPCPHCRTSWPGQHPIPRGFLQPLAEVPQQVSRAWGCPWDTIPAERQLSHGTQGWFEHPACAQGAEPGLAEHQHSPAQGPTPPNPTSTGTGRGPARYAMPQGLLQLPFYR